MNNVLESFVKLDESIINHLNVKNSLNASYIVDNNSIQLKLEKLNIETEEYYLSSIDDKYSVDKNNLVIHGCVNIENIGSVYGQEDNYSRVALDDTIIGVSLNAYSLVSKHNVSKPIGEIKITNENTVSIVYSFEFPTGSLADKLFITINLYVKEAATKSNIYATIDGTVLGTIYNAIINLEGTGSIFPIRVIASKKDPLWYVDLNYDDLNDTFCQNNICLNVNSLHDDFDKIGSQDITPENKAMWKEILTSFFSQIIMSLNNNEIEDLYKEDVYGEGSIGLFLQYIIGNFDIDKQILSNPILLNRKIMIWLDGIMK